MNPVPLPPAVRRRVQAYLQCGDKILHAMAKVDPSPEGVAARRHIRSSLRALRR